MNLLSSLAAASPLFLADIASIDASDRLRPVDEAHARWIAASMNEGGLIEPIIVRLHPTGNGLKLVAGAHRLRGGQINGDSQIAAIMIEATDDEARQIEIDENLARRELTALERAEFLAERKRTYERLHPEAAHGKAKKPRKGAASAKDANFASFAAFAKDAAKQVGLSVRAVQLATQIAAGLSPEAVILIRGTKIADNQAQLQALAALDPADQVKVAREIAEGRATNLAKAKVSAGMVPAGGAVREEDQPLAKLEPIVFRLSRQQLLDLRTLIDNRLAAMEPAKPARAKKGPAA
ncbi:chromosome partitioning protein, ParB family [Bosea sp. CRIB-10]|uniref:ParB N-terminal domain-containing protein n=1 Tax=Bosea sp. CRIB-10 TaxID=378404 RepID=UPI0008E94D60|nr:ParB N-terminal domain-containing protein [Bosea sp. CRIB-10]SFD74045.1 chromosome partitioning protein, ParB family [Bosea sp. CRIB-10]